ncbi:MAG TPA: DNA polymerase Y family protein [Burkholderiales bacterium]|nr:DNA polymerase Y family protein [Burkholderiales bacterium]
MLWLALHFRHLPLEVFTRGMQSDARPLAITSGAETSATIVAANRPAQARGVSVGMSISAAHALASGLHTLTRDIAKERATLARIAAWSLQFTSFVSIAESGEILLEIEGSLKLFGGLSKLYQHIGRGIVELGFDASMACAPTPLAALWFARAGVSVLVQHQDALRHTLEKLPANFICDTEITRDLLESFGARTLGDCLQLPRDGLARRTGQRLLDNLDRALGLRPDPQLPFVVPQTYNAALPLPAPVAQADALLFAARRLLAELCGWLIATGHGVQHPRFEFIHEKQIVTIITLELASASRDLDHLTTLLRERLARTELPCAAIEIAIASGRVVPLASRNLAFLPDSAGQEESSSRFVERLNARLGANTICGLTPHADYRPERAWRTCQPGTAAGENATCSPMPVRPLWLLTTPRLLREAKTAPHDHEGSPLSLIAGPERIEAGWWDGQHVARDYFVARNIAHSLLWIYRERDVGARWYMHGFFS